MNPHQLITGAVNRAESVFAIGSVEGIRFTACAVGCDIVILASDFQRVQIIPGASSGDVQVACIDACSETGKIAAAFGDRIKLLQPMPKVRQISKHKLDYVWLVCSTIAVHSPVSHLSFNLEGLRLLVGSDDQLQLWQHPALTAYYSGGGESFVPPSSFGHDSGVPKFEVGDEEGSERSQRATVWECVWKTTLSSPVRYMKFSPDGSLFATAGPNDTAVKIWYQDLPDFECGPDVQFSFIYLNHPLAVQGFEFRHLPRYMPRHYVANVLITWCRDNICRLWMETMFPSDGDIDFSAEAHQSDNFKTRGPRRRGQNVFKLKGVRQKITHNLKKLKRIKHPKRGGRSPLASGQSGSPVSLSSSISFPVISDHNPFIPAIVHFHLACSINAETDCFLVPSLSHTEADHTFAIHWLNNKDFVFSIGAEKILTEALLSEYEHHSLDTADGFINGEPKSPLHENGVIGHQWSVDSTTSPRLVRKQSQITIPTATTPSASGLDSTVSDSSSKDVTDSKLEMLLRDWYNSSDILFAIHPIDGSLLVWTVEWLDDPSRQPTVSFSSRLPGAFPLTDATSLLHNLVSFNPHYPSYVEVLRRNYESETELSEEESYSSIFLLTNHDNGSLNLWHLSVEAKFATILNISHVSRMCGHRFRIDRITCHPILPLFLTTSHHKLQKQATPMGAPMNVSANFMHFNSELILWKVNPVGPLCKSGGVRELARINSPELSAFANLAWIPAVLPSATLGSVCNSPSSCFVASDGKCLRVYQAVLDARGLLAELNFGKAKVNPMSSSEEGSSGVGSPAKSCLTFPVCSTQSTSRPGCILQLAPISSEDVKDWEQIMFLHVFPESAVLGIRRSEGKGDLLNVDHFEEKFYVVLLENREREEVVLHMWMLDMKSQPASPFKKGRETVEEEVSSPEVEGGFYPTARKQTPSAAQLYIRSKKVCTQSLVIPNGKIEYACPSAGHLPTASLYPGYQAPYLIMTSCSDEQVRFWKCKKSGQEESGKLVWEEWKMISGSKDSAVELEGRILALNSAHSGRLACAYDTTRQWNKHNNSDTVNVEVGILECESTGGTEWNREDTLYLKNIKIPNQTYKLPTEELDFHKIASPVEEMLLDWQMNPAKHPGATLMTRIPSIPQIHADVRHTVAERGRVSPRVVGIDFVATEDGSHILTISVGPKIFLFVAVSEDLAQQNMVIMKESEGHNKRPMLQKASSLAANVAKKLVKWINLRTLELDSVDGLPALPMTLSWVRDGILVIGMESEMRVYNQWRFTFDEPRQTKFGDSTKEEKTAEEKTDAALLTSPYAPQHQNHFTHLAIPLNVQRALSPSHSVLDLAKKEKEPVRKKSHAAKKPQQNVEKPQLSIADIVSDEGLFEASRLASPMLPQYHPKQLMELLNAGKTKRVKAILLHVLRCIQERNVIATKRLARQGSFRKQRHSVVEDENEEDLGMNRPRSHSQVGVKGMLGEEVALDYEEIDSIPPLPLHAILAADSDTAVGTADGDSGISEANAPPEQQYDQLFTGIGKTEEEDIDSAFDLDEEDSEKFRGRLSSVSSDQQHGINFGAKHCRILTGFLTHLHLPGLSSVDQMHLLAVADTLSSFSPDVIDRLAQANAGFSQQKTAPGGVLESSVGGGYASVGSGAETVDECGLRYLMAMKQHEYLTMCLPMKQRASLRTKGLSSAHVTWALHSETETELLNSISCLQKGNPTWNELRALGIGWWLKNTASLRMCVEKIAKAAFQKKQDPMDAAIFYLAMKKKNVLTHLFRSVSDVKMTDFFSRNFDEPLWKKAALKNAFVLMGKQRFHHAVGFFLLGGALPDAIQTCLNKLQDLQLAVVIIRLHETDPEKQNECLKQLLCTEILGCLPDDVGSFDEEEGGMSLPNASTDPFLRSVAFWHLKDYARAASTLLEDSGSAERAVEPILSDVFNFYVYLRNHPLVIRQKLAQGGITIGSTEKFLAVAKRLQSQITPAERKLYFRAASSHFHSGCALLALEVLCRLPKRLRLVLPGSATLSSLHSSRRESLIPLTAETGASLVGKPKEEVDELKLEWSDEEKEESSDEEGAILMKIPPKEEEKPPELKRPEHGGESLEKEEDSPTDVMAQQMKFVCCLKILMEELATLASGYEVEGGNLRYQLFVWLEKETAALKELCDYNVSTEGPSACAEAEEQSELESDDAQNPTLLHEALQSDRADMQARWQGALKRRRWLSSNQQLLRTFASYCALHGSQGVGLASARMELLLLLLELHQEPTVGARSLLASPVPVTGTFPLLFASVASYKTDISDPVRFLQGQAKDLLICFRELSRPPQFEESLAQMYVFYNLSHCLSACTYNALSDIEKVPVPKGAHVSGYLLRKRRRSASLSEEGPVITLPSKWPGVQNLVAVLSRSFDEDLPSLRLLLVEIFVSIYLALFTYCFTSYDSRWLFRLVAHPITPEMFASVFGGGAEKRQETQPSRPTFKKQPPPRPSPPKSRDRSPMNLDKLSSTVDPASLRAKFHARVFGPTASGGAPQISGGVQGQNIVGAGTQAQTIMKWVPPKQSVVTYFMAKPHIKAQEELGIDYDSDDSHADSDQEEETFGTEEKEERELPEHLNPNGYAWAIIRLASVRQIAHKVKQLLTISGLETGGLELAGSCPRVHACFKTLDRWQNKLTEALDSFPGGCPPEFLPHKYLDAGGAAGPSLHKYRSILESGNTPFESEDPAALPVRRLWLYLVRQEQLMEIFIRYIFKGKPRETTKTEEGAGAGLAALPEPMKIVQREQDPILSFGVSNCNSGWIVVSTGRELQEMDISAALQTRTDWMHDPTELDIALAELKRNALVDNDDYLLLNGLDKKDTAVLTGRGSSFLCKRQVSGIRRMEAHPALPYYVTGANDGSVRLWEWGVPQPLYTPRVAGQFAKVTRTRFSLHGNKFGITDGDGVICLWQASQSGTTLKKPYFSVKCHCKSAADFIFIGGASSLLATAGLGTGDNNLALWDTLQPVHKALIHSWACHPDEGALALQYVPNHQVLISGGKNGELSFWDLRARQLRHSCKAFEGSSASVKSLAVDPAYEYLACGSSDGDLSIWSLGAIPQLLYSLTGEHSAGRSGILRSSHGSVQLVFDGQGRLYSCGGDSLRLRLMPQI